MTIVFKNSIQQSNAQAVADLSIHKLSKNNSIFEHKILCFTEAKL